MLGRRGNTGALEAANHRAAERRDQFGILSKRSGSDHRISWITVDVANGREVNVDSDGGKFFSEDPTDLIRQLFGARCSEGHVAGETGAVAYGHELSAFLISSDQ